MSICNKEKHTPQILSMLISREKIELDGDE
jgi:hypothetical protein